MRHWRRVGSWAMLGGILLGAACSANAPVSTGPERPTTTAGTTTTARDRAADRASAEGALLGVADLAGDGWEATPTTTTTTAADGSAKFIECPGLAASHPAFGEAAKEVVVGGPEIGRRSPGTQVTQAIVVFDTEADATAAMDAFRDPAAHDCVKSLLGRQKGAPPASTPSLEVTEWPAAGTSTGRIGFDMAATVVDRTGTRSFHVGFALAQYGRALALTVVFSEAPLAEGDAAIADAAATRLQQQFG